MYEPVVSLSCETQSQMVTGLDTQDLNAGV